MHLAVSLAYESLASTVHSNRKETTAHYTRVSTRNFRKVTSPLDRLAQSKDTTAK